MWKFESKEPCKPLPFRSKCECAVCGAISVLLRRGCRATLRGTVGVAFPSNICACSYIRARKA